MLASTQITYKVATHRHDEMLSRAAAAREIAGSRREARPRVAHTPHRRVTARVAAGVAGLVLSVALAAAAAAASAGGGAGGGGAVLL